MRQIWFNRVTELLPKVEPVHIFCIDSVEKELDNSAKIVITSYGYLKPLFKMFKKFEFGTVIIDQSHYIKEFRAERTRALIALCKNVKRAILIDGSPALNNPRELYTQLRIIDPNFMYFSTYAFRYCAGELVGGCLFANGATNCEELNVLLHKKFMTRHTKAEYDGYLTNKLREQIILDVRLNQRDRINLEMHHLKYAREPGDLFKYYALTAEFKIEQVCSYVEDFLQISADKFIVFAYHQVMLNALSDLLSNLDVEFIRVDSGCNLKDDLVYRFQRDTECRAAILSLNTCATGFNLTAAKTVIFAELAYSPEIMQQAEGRVHRVGQEGDVEVKYLCAEGTLDNHLWYGILKKQEILNTIGIDDDDIELNFIASRHVYQEPRIDENMIINEDDSDDDVVQPVQLLRKRRTLSSDDEEDTNKFHKIII
uniref:CSON003223 protein n=1 Tax=Culicoides sonorensis TaxID=179676 RepID=A0A336M4Q5_CULSO